MLDPKVIDNFLTENLSPYMKNHQESYNENLRTSLSVLQQHADNIKNYLESSSNSIVEDSINDISSHTEQDEIVNCGLGLREIQRYSRQLILPELRVTGQLKIKSASVLIVGAGGLGCPAALYLAASGIGRIGIIDGDTVDISNLHRQIAHKERKLGQSKSDSLCQAVKDLNTNVDVVSYKCSLTSHNAIEIFNDSYDVILDATDNPATRYLINDACQLTGKPLVSGSALRWEGQLTVYNYPPGIGPTYRCLFPDPPNPDTVTNCSDGGVMGVVTGVIGCLQALETVKIIISSEGKTDNEKPDMSLKVLSGTMLIFDATTSRFRHIKLRPRRTEATESVKELLDYQVFCRSALNDKPSTDKLSTNVMNKEEKIRISVEEYQKMIRENEQHILVDVRTEPEMEICSLPNSINVPIEDIQSQDSLDRIVNLINKQKDKTDASKSNESSNNVRIVLVCRRGNDSQVACQFLKEHITNPIKSNVTTPVLNYEEQFSICDIIGGLQAWAKRIDKHFPIY